ncbi:MAG: NAD-dependent epimerase/dehydratase family protein [Sphingobium sp.]|nr:NAD-dependent epimerase/dehydratase family protein [Sphingobium sp.]
MATPEYQKIAVIGASGYVGGPIADEARARGHQVTGIRRSATSGANEVAADIFDTDRLSEILEGHDVVIHAFNPGRGSTAPDIFDVFVAGHRSIIAATLAAGVKRLLCVGGAGSLITRSGLPLLESDEWPAQFDIYKPSILATRELFYLLKETPQDLDWVYLSPSNMLTDQPARGSYRVGSDHMLYDADGISHISVTDYAKAMIDELEQPRHHRARFTVGY